MDTLYLRFVLLDSPGKTYIYAVNSRRHGNQLGIIKWYGAWRQYVLFPVAGTLWNPACLDDVADFMCRLMADRKASPTTGKAT